MFCDVHERKFDGSVGRLLTSIDKAPDHRGRDGVFIEFDGEMHPVKTGIRNFIIITAERWAKVSASTWKRL